MPAEHGLFRITASRVGFRGVLKNDAFERTHGLRIEFVDELDGDDELAKLRRGPGPEVLDRDTFAGQVLGQRLRSGRGRWSVKALAGQPNGGRTLRIPAHQHRK